MKFFYTTIFSLLFSTLLISQITTFDSFAGNTGSFAAFGPASGVIGQEDYIMDLSGTSNPAGTTAELTEFAFVGGVDVVGGEIQIDFLDAAGDFSNGFTIALPQAGTFEWILTPPAEFIIPTSGFVEITVDPNNNGGVLGQWFLVDEVLAVNSIGTSPGNPDGLPASGDGNPFVYALRMIIADPPLPVELMSFTIDPNDKGFGLEWVTASEFNNMGFEVERSIDGKNFQEVGFIKGLGTSVQEHTYTFFDEDIVKNTNYYYRLRQVDFDGQYEYSKIINGLIKGKDGLAVGEFIPNPASDYTQIQLNTDTYEEVNLIVFDATGKMIQSNEYDLSPGNHTIQLDLYELTAGTYFIKVFTASKSIQKKLIID